MMRGLIIFALGALFGVARAEEPNWPSDEAHRWAEQATVLHKQAQTEDNEQKYLQAHALYQKYLAKYPDVKDGLLSYFDAELLFKLQRYDEAAKMYDRVLAIAPKGKNAENAAYGYVIATKNAVRRTDVPDAGPPCPDMKPCAIPADAQRMLAAFDRFLAIASTHKERPNMEYRKARIYYEYQHFTEAAALFDHIFVSYPNDELAVFSANLEMDCLAILKRFDDLRALIERIKKSRVMRDDKVRQQVQTLDAALKKKGK
jgi:tetratricopeptide (TPR) repeat protein